MNDEDSVEAGLQLVESVVYRMSRGAATEQDFEEAVAGLRRAALEQQEDNAWEGTTLSATGTVGANLRLFREVAHWTQDQVAASMTSIGFSWSRVTVAQVEGGERRRASFEELFGLAALFGRPVAEFLTPRGHGLDLNDSPLEVPGEVARELVLGRQGQLGRGGSRWRAAAYVSAAAQSRPAAALERNTDSGGKK